MPTCDSSREASGDATDQLGPASPQTVELDRVLDNDGDTDIVIANNHGKARVYRNDSAQAHWLGVEVRGSKAQPQTIGTHVWREALPRQRLRIGTDGSYASANDPRRVFGLAGTSTQ